MEWVGLALGVTIVVGTFASVLDALVVPRGSPARFALTITDIVGAGLRRVAHLIRGYEGRDRVLVMHAPLSLLATLVAWLGLLVVGYGFIAWPLSPGLDLAQSMRFSGSSLFTLGFATADGAGPTSVAFVGAGSGMVVVALQIAYLPTIYGSFNRRETLVTLLESRAGVPAWGPELLWRHQRVGLVDSLPALFAQWETWAADVAETHTTYPVLVHFRSPNSLRSWVVSLLAVLDAAAMYLSLAPSRAPSEARLCLRMGFTSVRDLAHTLGLPHDPDPRPDAPIALTREEFEEGVALLTEIGFPLERSADEAWADFRGWRVNYEGVVHALADLVSAPPAMWSGPRTHIPEQPMPVRRPVDRRPETPDGTSTT